MASIEPFDWATDTNPILSQYFSQNRILTQHQTKSYDDLIRYIIPQFIERNNPITIATQYDDKLKDFRKKYIVEFGQTYLTKPLIHENNDVIKPLYPHEARIRGLTYSAPMFIDIKHTLITKDEHGNTISNDSESTLLDTKIPFTRIPVMLHSDYCHLSDRNEFTLKDLGECPLDQGGYFIINGSEKVVIPQERVAENQVYCWTPPKKSTSKYALECEIKSSIDQRFYPVKTNKVKMTKAPTLRMIQDQLKKNTVIGSTLHVQCPYMREDIPLFIMFRAFGVGSERDMVNFILGGQGELSAPLEASLHDARSRGVIDEISALTYISTKLNLTFGDDFQKQDKTVKLKYVRDILNREFLPHVGTNSRKKAFFLGHMVKTILDCYFGRRPYDDRDHLGNKRLDLVGPLISQLIRTSWIKIISDIRQQSLACMNADNSPCNLPILASNTRKIVQSEQMEKSIKYALATGNWGPQKNMSTTKKGIAQVLNMLSQPGALSHTRRIQSPLERAGSKIVSPRKLHGTHYGMICPHETPEGQQIGVVKNLALQAQISIQTSDYPVRMALARLGAISIATIVPNQLAGYTLILVNGDPDFVIPDAEAEHLRYNLVKLRRMAILDPVNTSIAYDIDNRVLKVQTDGGRYLRPLLIVDSDGQLAIQKLSGEYLTAMRNKELNWRELMMGGKVGTEAVIEYLDTAEIETRLIAINYMTLTTNSNVNLPVYFRYTHCELSPLMMLSIVASQIPYSNHIPAPRACYQSAMGKQSLGLPRSNYNQRMDTMLHVLNYPQRPLVESQASEYTFLNQRPHGITAMLLYACYTGYNQEDSTIINYDAIQRGFFNSLYFRTYKDKEQKHKLGMTAIEQFEKPAKKIAKHLNTHAIDDHGVPILGSVVDDGDIIIGKTMTYTDENDKEVVKDASLAVRSGEHGTIDLVIPTPKPTAEMVRLGAVYPTPMTSIYPFNSEGHRMIACRVSILRKPEIGDKFATRYSQKGTVGMTYPMEDLPFTSSGLYPDIIFNPHGIPSRMTAGMMIETLLGRLAVKEAQVQDGTPFKPVNFNQVSDKLKSYGIHPFSREVMYNGFTGKMFEVDLFYAPTYYQRLKHMVVDKIHSRESGPVQLLTRQPAEGRSRDGGLRAGEMERDVFIAHGASRFGKAKMMDASDAYPLYISKQHETVITANPKDNFYRYNGHNVAREDVHGIQIPYAAHILKMNLETCGIDMRIKV